MIKYSVIIPVYNKEKYISKCIDSVLNQTYNNYEIIIINDGSTDNSEDVIKKYTNQNIKYFKKENGGVSDARNYGIGKASGKYFTFVDADDYVSNDLLSIIDNNINEDLDILSFNIEIINNNNSLVIEKPAFDVINGEQAIIKFIDSKTLFDTPVAYIYNTYYFINNNFLYAKDRIHEDFGLTPLVIAKANKIKSIKDVLYYYIKNNDGITGDTTELQLKKKAWDMLYHFDYLYNRINDDKNISINTKKIFKSFIANAIIDKGYTLDKAERNNYIKELNKRKPYSLLLNNSLSRKIKRLIIKINVKLYYKLFFKEVK